MTAASNQTILGLTPGEIIEGRFQIGELIGYGGQGAVLSVNHLEWDRRLALKLPLPDAVNSARKSERFVREAEAWIRLGVHPNIVRCWFVRKIAGLPGLFLDLISGGSLEDKMKNQEIGPGGWNEILNVMIGMSEGLAHAHGLGMVHRDIKPENLLLRRNGEVCVTDFGLVKSADRQSMAKQSRDEEEVSAGSGATGVGEFLGTPRYGAPEQWNKGMSITPATDIYAVGVILFELLAGRRPFDAPDENPDPLELIHRHLKKAPPSPRDFQQDVPTEFEALCLRCLSKDPLQRPQSGSELVQLLVAMKEKTTGIKHARPAPLPEKERPALLNNAGVSLLSLGRHEKGRENIEKGLLLQADHPECIYNLVQLERRAGRMGEVESLQRLRRANAALPLALLCIEEGHAKLAYQIVKAIPDEKKSGLLHRTEGDALMYMGEYDEAADCYRKAKEKLPSDQATVRRLALAERKSRVLDGRIYFPISGTCLSGDFPEPRGYVLLTNDSKLLTASPGEISLSDPEWTEPTVTGQRPPTARPATRVWHTEKAMVVEDEAGFELWNKATHKPMGRSSGKIMAISRSLSHIMFSDGQKVMLLDNLSKSTSQVVIDGSADGAMACFSEGQTGLFVLTREGILGKMDPKCRVEPLAWPPRTPDPDKVCSFQVHECGLVALATKDNQLLLLDLEKRTLVRRKLPFPVKSLRFDASGETIVVGNDKLYGVFQRNGRLLHRGKGACAVDPTGRYLLGWAGTLNVYSLGSFHKVRSFSQQIPPPDFVRWTLDGRLALTGTGEKYQVWEVDEEYRVYERELLLTPGETYEDLIQSYIRYNTAITDALKFKDTRQYKESYWALCKARAVKGFLQSEPALALQWELCTILEPGVMESLWERMFFRGISATAFTRNGRLLALSRGKRCEVRVFTGTSAQERYAVELASVPEGLHYHNSNLLVVESGGALHALNNKDGGALFSLDLGLGEIAGSAYRAGHLVVWNKAGTMRSLDPSRQSLTEPLEARRYRSVLPLAAGRVMCAGADKVEIFNLKRGEREVSLGMPRGVSCVSTLDDEEIVVAGYEDGSLRAIDIKSGKELFSVKWDIGTIIGIKINRSLAFGAAVSASGRLVVFNLDSGESYLSFTAHSQAIPQLEMTDDGRFLLTRSKDGQFRLWETCWKLKDDEGTAEISWLDGGTTLSRLGKFLGR